MNFWRYSIAMAIFIVLSLNRVQSATSTTAKTGSKSDEIESSETTAQLLSQNTDSTRCPEGYFYNPNEGICKNCTTCDIHDVLKNLCTSCGTAYHFIGFKFVKNNGNKAGDGQNEAGDDYTDDENRIYRVIVNNNGKNQDDDLIDVLPTNNEQRFWKKFAMCLIGILVCVMVLFAMFVIVACRRDITALRSKPEGIEVLSRRARLFSRDRLNTNEYVVNVLNQSLLLPSSAAAPSGSKHHPEIRIAPDGTPFIDEIFTQEDSAGKRVATTFRLPLLDNNHQQTYVANDNRISSLWTEMNKKTNKSLQKIDLGNVTPSRSRPASAILPSTSSFDHRPSPV